MLSIHDVADNTDRTWGKYLLRFVATFLMAILCLMLQIATVHAESIGTITSEYATVLLLPAVQDLPICKAYKGAKLDILEWVTVDDDLVWYKVRVNDSVTGYIRYDYIDKGTGTIPEGNLPQGGEPNIPTGIQDIYPTDGIDPGGNKPMSGTDTGENKPTGGTGTGGNKPTEGNDTATDNGNKSGGGDSGANASENKPVVSNNGTIPGEGAPNGLSGGIWDDGPGSDEPDEDVVYPQEDDTTTPNTVGSNIPSTDDSMDEADNRYAHPVADSSSTTSTQEDAQYSLVNDSNLKSANEKLQSDKKKLQRKIDSLEEENENLTVADEQAQVRVPLYIFAGAGIGIIICLIVGAIVFIVVRKTGNKTDSRPL